MTLEASIQSLADAVREFTKIYGEQTTQSKANFAQSEISEAKVTKPPKSKSAAPAVEPVAAPTPAVVSAPVSATPPETPPTVDADPFAADAAPQVATYDDVVAALRTLASAPGKGRDAVIAVVAKFGAKTVPELATKADVSLDAVLAAAKAAMA